MKKIDIKVRDAVREYMRDDYPYSRETRLGNTIIYSTSDGIDVYLHGNCIAEYNRKAQRLTLDARGYLTPTTRNRMQAVIEGTFQNTMLRVSFKNGAIRLISPSVLSDIHASHTRVPVPGWLIAQADKHNAKGLCHCDLQFDGYTFRVWRDFQISVTASRSISGKTCETYKYKGFMFNSIRTTKRLREALDRFVLYFGNPTYLETFAKENAPLIDWGRGF